MASLTSSLPDVSSLDVEEAKQILRSAVREERRRKAEQARTKFESDWIEAALNFVGDRKVVACYVSTSSEPRTDSLLDELANAGKTVVLPKLGPGLTRAWGIYKGRDDLQQMAPGRPPEPSGEALDKDYLENVEALIIPALAVNHEGSRLGQGGGWYDRALKQVRPHTLVGAMIFPWEYTDAFVPQDDMDVRVPFVILPDGHVATRAADETEPRP